VVISTTWSHPDRSVKNAPSRLSAEDITGDLEISLKALGTDYTDILFLHRDDIEKPVEEIMPVLHNLVKSGKVRILGASNWTAGRIAEANLFARQNGLTPFSVSQVCWSLALSTAAQTRDLTHIIMDAAEFSWYRDEQFPCMAWSPSAKGFFTKVINGVITPENAAGNFGRYGHLAENFRRAERVKALASDLNAPAGSVVLAYILCSGIPANAVIGFSSEEQFGEAMLSAEINLTAEQIKFLECGE
jgi:aryl-alcohol dehydrogenase-like predicted oxidoreductase